MSRRGGRPPRQRGVPLVVDMSAACPEEIESIEYCGYAWLPRVDAEHGPVFVRQGGPRPGPMLRVVRVEGGWDATLLFDRPREDDGGASTTTDAPVEA